MFSVENNQHDSNLRINNTFISDVSSRRLVFSFLKSLDTVFSLQWPECLPQPDKTARNEVIGMSMRTKGGMVTGRMTNKTAAGDRETKRAPHDNELGGCLMAEATFYDSRTSAARKADDFCTLDD